MTEDPGREEFRAACLAELPRWYSPWAHLGFPSAVGLGAAAVALSKVHDVRPWELGFAALTWVIANAFEWRVHKDILHRRRWPLGMLFEKHTPMHHRLFETDTMAIRSFREAALVLVPFYGVLGILAAVLPASAALWVGGLHNAAALYFAVSVLYFVSYEWLHLSYHLPETHPVGRLGLVRFLRRHHALHHSPERMQRWNFNVTIPLWDLVRGTYWRGESVAAVAPRAKTAV